MIDSQNSRQRVDDGDETRIPVAPGVYAFHLNIVGLGRLGLRRGEKISDTNADRIRESLNSRLNLLSSLHRGESFTGLLSDSRRMGRLKTTIHLHGTTSPPELNLNSLNNQDLDDVIALLEGAMQLLPPIYIGIACDQPLRSRYIQHRSDFESNHERNVFGFRLRQSGLRWTDLSFSYSTLPLLATNNESLRLVESILHSINPPTMSIK